MAKRRHAAKDEILLVPFLDILCSLIGVLVLIIVVLTISQTQQTEGRTEAEMQRAVAALAMKKELAKQKVQDVAIKELLAKLQTLQQEQKEKEERLAKLRKLLSTSKDVQEQNKQMSQALLKELDNLALEIEGLKKQITETKPEIEKLLAEIKKRQLPPDKKPPAVVVQPSGSGSGKTEKLYFIEASGSKLVFTVGDKKETVAAAEATIIASAPLNYFLTQVSRDRDNAQLIFLLRDDGTTAYVRGGGWAQGKYGLKISRLLIPGQGDIDTSLFGARAGKVGPVPPDYQPPAPATPPPPNTN
jgi:biopolymer transport protein ExbD